MIKLIQILKYYKNYEYSLSEVMDELTELMDNEQSEHFTLDSEEINSIRTIFENDSKFDSALKVSGF